MPEEVVPDLIVASSPIINRFIMVLIFNGCHQGTCPPISIGILEIQPARIRFSPAQTLRRSPRAANCNHQRHLIDLASELPCQSYGSSSHRQEIAKGFRTVIQEDERNTSVFSIRDNSIVLRSLPTRVLHASLKGRHLIQRVNRFNLEAQCMYVAHLHVCRQP